MLPLWATLLLQSSPLAHVMLSAPAMEFIFAMKLAYFRDFPSPRAYILMGAVSYRAGESLAFCGRAPLLAPESLISVPL